MSKSPRPGRGLSWCAPGMARSAMTWRWQPIAKAIRKVTWRCKSSGDLIAAHIDMQFADVHAMLRLPLREDGSQADCDFACVSTLCDPRQVLEKMARLRRFD